MENTEVILNLDGFEGEAIDLPPCERHNFWLKALKYLVPIGAGVGLGVLSVTKDKRKRKKIAKMRAALEREGHVVYSRDEIIEAEDELANVD